MSSKFAGVTFDEQPATPSDDAIIRRAILDDGILTGCEFSYTGSTLTMTAGQLMICGRQVKHPSTQNWAVADATTGFARLLLTIDLTRTSSKDTFEQVVDTIEYASAVDGFADLVQDDINASGTKYQIVAAVVSLASGGISGIVSQLSQTTAALGDKSVIIVTDLPTGATVTATKGPIRKTTTEKNAEWWFKGLDLGEWTLDAALDGETATTKFNIERFGVYYVPMSFFKATIQTKYPVGSTCTCSKGDKTFTAPDTSGQYDFVVDSAGEWTVSCEKSLLSASEVVNITENGQTKDIELFYGIKIYNGEDSGWIRASVGDQWQDGKVTFETGMMTLTNESDIQLVASVPDETYDLSKYSTLRVYINELSTGLENGSNWIGVSNNKSFRWNASGSGSSLPSAIISSKSFEVSGVIDLDISSVSGNYYPAVLATRNKTIRCREIRLIEGE